MENTDKHEITWILSSPDSFLTPYITDAIKLQGAGKAMSAEYYLTADADEIAPRVVAIFYDCRDVAKLYNQMQSVDRAIVIADETTERYDNHDNATIVRPGWIIGTGMTGAPMRLLDAINRGAYFHTVQSENTRQELIHAADLAKAAVKLGTADNLQPEIHLHDDSIPTIKEIAEAFALRLKGKRIYTLKTSWARLLMSLLGTRQLLDMTTDNHECRPATSIDGVTPRNTLEYITTHQYGPEDI